MHLKFSTASSGDFRLGLNNNNVPQTQDYVRSFGVDIMHPADTHTALVFAGWY